MTARPSRPPTTTARRVVGAGVVGVAGVASALATAPVATAAPDVVVPATAPQQAGAVLAAAPAAAPAVVPNYGFQKVRVGVQVADGSYVPEGTTTAGTEVTYTVGHADGTSDAPQQCTTKDNADPGSTATWCEFTGSDLVPAVTTAPGSADAVPEAQRLVLLPGDSVTVTQTTVNANLRRDTATAVVPPCETGGSIVCTASDGSDLATTVTFDDPGLPPVATDDTASTTVDVPVSIDVFANDDTVVGAPVTGMQIVAAPGHGTAAFPDPETEPGSEPSDVARAAVTPPATAATVLYTPARGFTGVDTFRYSYSTANGTATALVTVTVTGPTPTTPTTTPTSSVSPTSTRTTASGPALATTGTDSGGLLLAGAALVVVGGAVTGLGRRRATHRR